MKKLIGFLFLGFLITACGGDDCKTCTGTFDGETVDGTVCDNGDGTVTLTDNIDGTSFIDSSSVATNVAEAESLGLSCD